MAKISFECPECSAKLSVTDRSKLGKKIRCPKCQEVFEPEVPDDEELVESFDDLDDNEEDGDDESEQPIIRRKEPAGDSRNSAKKAGKKGANGGSKTPLIIGGVVGLLALAGVGIAFSGLLGGKAAAPAAPADPVPIAASPRPAAQPTATETAAAAPATSAPVAAPATVDPPAAAPKVETAAAPLTSTMPAPAVKPAGNVQLTPAEKTLGLRWLFSDTDIIMHAKVADIWKAPLLKSAFNNPSMSESVAMLKKFAGVGPADIESVTIGMGNVSESFATGFAMGATIGAGGPPPAVPPTSTQRFIAVVKTKTSIDLAKVVAEIPGFAAKDASGKPYFEGQTLPGMSDSISCWSPEPKIVIVGTTKDLLAAIERGETIVPRKEFAAINHTHHFVMALVVPDFESDSKFAALASNPGFAQFRDTLKPYTLQMAGLGVTVRGGFDVQVLASAMNEEGSKKLKADIESGLKTIRTMLDNYAKTAPPLLAELADLLLKNTRLEEKNHTVSVSTNVPDSAQDKLEQLPGIVMLMAMSGGLGSPAAGPGGFGQSSFGPGGFGPGNGMTVQLPGETPATKPVKVDGLINGMSISAKTAWSPISMSSDGTTTTPIDVLVDVTGTDVDKICASAGIIPKTMTLQGGGRVKRSKVPGVEEHPENALRMFNASEANPLEHPPQTLRMKLTIDPPAKEVRSIAVLEGSFKFLTAADSKEITIDEAPKAAKRPLKGEEFKAADLKLRISHSSVHPAWMTLTCGKDYFLSQVKGLPDNLLSISEFDKDQTLQRLTSPEKEFPDDLQLQFKLFSDIKENVVTFRFENVQLPSPESKPSNQVSTAAVNAKPAPGSTKPGEQPGRPGLAQPKTVKIGINGAPEDE